MALSLQFWGPHALHYVPGTPLPEPNVIPNLMFTTMLWIKTLSANSIDKEAEAQRLSKLPVSHSHLDDEFGP